MKQRITSEIMKRSLTKALAKIFLSKSIIAEGARVKTDSSLPHIFCVQIEKIAWFAGDASIDRRATCASSWTQWIVTDYRCK